MSVLTGMYHFEVSRTALYPLAYVQVHTTLYCHVLPWIHCRMKTRAELTCSGSQGPPPGPLRGVARDLSGGGGEEQHPADAVGGGVEQRVCLAAQRRGLQGVGHHVREGPARTEARDSAALPLVRRPPVEDRPAHQHSTEIPGRSCLDGEADQRKRGRDSPGPARRGCPGPAVRAEDWVGCNLSPTRRRRWPPRSW
jgi:hypothetical protein